MAGKGRGLMVRRPAQRRRLGAVSGRRFLPWQLCRRCSDTRGAVVRTEPRTRLACFDGGDWSSPGAWTIYEEPWGWTSGRRLGPPVAAPDGALWVLTPSGLVSGMRQALLRGLDIVSHGSRSVGSLGRSPGFWTEGRSLDRGNTFHTVTGEEHGRQVQSAPGRRRKSHHR